MSNTLLNEDSKTALGASNPLTQEYEKQKELFDLQLPMIQRFFEGQAGPLAEAFISRTSPAKFNLPNQVAVPRDGQGEPQKLPVPQNMQEQIAGGLLGTITRTDVRTEIRNRLSELEDSTDRAVAVAAGLVRYSAAYHMIHNLLPTGRSVTYRAADGEEIPTIPVGEVDEAVSAITAESDAIVEEGRTEAGRGELLVPYVPAARRFYLPQWVAFDDEGHLLAKSTQEAAANIASMQRFVEILHASVALAGYMVADPEYQRKRYGILGQLINQGRALAMHQTREIIETIKRRAAANDLNRGLSLSLPYFDDQDLIMGLSDFQVIPAGRIMFVPAFVVRAAEEEAAKVAQDTRLSASTRKYLLKELKMLQQAFTPDA